MFLTHDVVVNLIVPKLLRLKHECSSNDVISVVVFSADVRKPEPTLGAN